MTRRFGMAVLATTILLASCGRPAKTPAADVHAMMLEQVQPAAQTYWDAVQFISDSDGNHKVFPRTQAQWQRVEAAAKRLQYLGSKMKTAEYAATRNEDWRDYAQGLIDVSAQAAQAAADRQPDKVFETGSILYNVCSACHQAYLPASAAQKGVAPTAGKER